MEKVFVLTIQEIHHLVRIALKVINLVKFVGKPTKVIDLGETELPKEMFVDQI